MTNEQLYEIGHQHLSQNDCEQALPYLHKAALGGHVMAQLWLESIYISGQEG
jgi:TPR repeat protein